MRKKWIIVALFIVVAASLAIAIPALCPPTPGATYANYSRIENGMSRDDVVRLLGEPNEKGAFFLLFPVDFTKDPFPPVRLFWRSGNGDYIDVGLDGDGRVIHMAWNGELDQRSGIEKLRDRLPWLARKPPPFLTEIE
jgi:hypothetical protein